MLYNKNDVLKFLPHRDPFLFIDSIEDVVIPAELKGKTIDRKNIVGAKVFANFFTRPDLELFRGHFPGRPILPGVVQIEIMAQATSFVFTKILTNSLDQQDKFEMALVSVSNAKFRKPIMPGMHLKIESVITKTRGQMMESECMIKINNELMSEATLMASIIYKE